jgi:hypothetical protein
MSVAAIRMVSISPWSASCRKAGNVKAPVIVIPASRSAILPPRRFPLLGAQDKTLPEVVQALKASFYPQMTQMSQMTPHSFICVNLRHLRIESCFGLSTP